jgi:hypothetical protein
MVNVTVSMDEETARWVRVAAAKAGLSVSRWLGQMLAEKRAAEADAAWEAGRDARRKAGEAFLASPLRDISDNGKLPSREELYDEVLRRYERAGVREGQAGSYKAEDGE